MLKVGQKAPQFTLPNQDGNKISLKDYLGKVVVLYFYPKDMTSGCTKEACDFRDEFPNFKKLKAEVIGISKDSVKSHQKFIEKNNLPFTLLSDEEKKVLEKYDVWKEKSMYGKKYMGIERTTFLIDENGKIIKIYPKVKVNGHAENILKDLKELYK
ncbi:MAG: thioredoxin-dependent thiol peroxidase [Melioribacteraceae bacterium]|nr:thioredoxin-dependent thiol peroxidase [Melioribacteraceae bacterium]